MALPNDNAQATTTFGDCSSQPRNRSFYATSYELIALTKGGAYEIPPLNYRRYSYIERITKLVFHLVHMHNMSLDMGVLDMSSDLIFWWIFMACIHKFWYTMETPTMCTSYPTGPDPLVGANVVPFLRIVVPLC
jgi:hypothetical protein